MKFVDEGFRLRRSTPKAKTRLGGRLQAEASPSTIVSNTMLDLNSGSHRRGRPHRGQGGPVTYRLGSSMQDCSQLLASFISHMFPLGVASVQKSFLGSWLWHVPTRLGCSAVLDYAALSLALAYFARVSGDQPALRHAELSYNMALKALAAAIADKDRRFGADVLCATMLLGNYEVRERAIVKCGCDSSAAYMLFYARRASSITAEAGSGTQAGQHA